MKKVCCLSVLWVLCSGFVLMACPPVPRFVSSYFTPSYVAPTYVAPTIVKEYIPVQVFTPVFVRTFTVGYTPPVPVPATAPGPAAGVAPAAGGGLSEVLIELRKLSGRIDSIERSRTAIVPPEKRLTPSQGEESPAPPPNPAEVRATRAGIKARSCAACHTAGKLAEDVPFALMTAEGNEIPLSPDKELRLIRYVYKGGCPPKGNKLGIKPLTDEEFAIMTMGDMKK